MTIGPLLLALAAAASAAQQPDRSRPPTPGAPPDLKLPALQERKLQNGLPVWIVELHEVPVVQVSLIVRAGSAADPTGRFGLASLTAAMLDEGAGGKSALEIADAIDFLGVSLSTGSGFDSSAVRLWTPVAKLNDALPVMAQIALRPDFPANELDRLRRERLVSLLQSRDDAGSVASQAFPRLVYGPTHRYGIGEVGTAEALNAITVDDLRRFYDAQYRPSGAALIVVGDITPDAVVKALDQAFGHWIGAKAGATAAQVPEAPQLKARRIFLIDKPGAAQSQIRIGWIGAPRSTPDYFPIQVMNTILGGAFTSRLNQNLREEHGYAYGASSGFSMRKGAGPFVAGAGVQTDKTAESVNEFFKELQGILQPVPPDELEKAKNYLAFGYPGEFETTGDMASRLEALYVYDLPEDYFGTYVRHIRAVTAADVQRVAQKYIQPDKFAVVIAGDRKAIEAPVRALNLGPVTVMSVEDVLGKMPATP